MSDALQLNFFGPRHWCNANTPNNVTVDASNDGVAWSWEALNTEAITHLGFRYGLRTGTPPTFIIGLETPVATTGFPDGVVLGGGTPASATFTPPASTAWDGTWQWVALANAYTPARGQPLMTTIRYSSGTIDATNKSTFTDFNSGYIVTGSNSYPISLILTAGTWAISQSVPVFGVRTANTRYGNIIQSVYTTNTASTAGHRMAMAFTCPAGWGDTRKVVGMRFYGNISSAAGKTPKFGLWNAGGVVQDTTFDTEYARTPTTNNRFNELYFDESILTALNDGTKYYCGLEVVDAVSGALGILGIQLAEANDLLAFPGGLNVHLATFDGLTWTDDQTVRPMAELMLDDITEPAGGAVSQPPGGRRYMGWSPAT